MPGQNSMPVNSMSLLIGFCGLVLFLLGKNQMDLYILIVISAAAMIAYRPKAEEITDVDQKSD